MSLQNVTVQKTFLITGTQNNKLKAFCKYNKISGSQLLRLFIDDLYLQSVDNLRDSTESVGFRVQNFVGAFDKEMPIKQVSSDGYGNNKQVRWFKKMKWYNNSVF